MYNQNVILILLYTHRFATQAQLMRLLGHTNHSQVSRILRVLIKHNVVDKFESVHRFEASSYYLTREGCRYLADNMEAFGIRAVPRHLYRNREASPALIERCQIVVDVYLILQKLYGDQLVFISKTELSQDPDFIRPLPDGYFELGGRRFALEFVPDDLWKTLIAKRLRLLSSGMGDYYDMVLLIVNSCRAHTKVGLTINNIGYDSKAFTIQRISSRVVIR